MKNRLRAVWDGRNSARNLSIRYLEVIDGNINPRNGQVRPAATVKEFMPALDKLNLDVATIVGIHGESASMQAARAAALAAK